LIRSWSRKVRCFPVSRCRLFAFIPEYIRPALAGHDDVFPAVSVEVRDADLQADAGAVFGYGELLKLLLGPAPLEVVDGAGLGVAGVVAAVGPDPPAGDELGLAVVFDVFPDQGVRLGKAVVDEVVTPVGTAILVVVAAFFPVEAVVVAVAPDDLPVSVAVEVDDKHGATGVREVPVGVLNPRLRRGVGFGRSYQPLP